MNESEKRRQLALQERFEKLFGARPEAIWSAAGRVNLIGEHIDYCGGKVLPASLSLACRVAVRKNNSNVLRLAATTTPARLGVDLGDTDAYRNVTWGNYQAGVAHMMKEAGYRLVGADILYDCDIPFGVGLSSSAAIQVATAYALARTGGNSVDLTEIARLTQRAENEYCGVHCGIMDQFVSANGRAAHAMLLDCNTLAYEQIPLDMRDCVLILANSNRPRELAKSKYNERRSETEEAFRILKQFTGKAALADVTETELMQYRDWLAPAVYRRARHVATESRRVEESVEALRCGDLATFGKLLNASHASLRDDCEVTGFELDALAEAAWDSSGCLGSRMTGAGFGGCTVSVVRADCADAFKREVGLLYAKECGLRASFYSAEIADGIREYPIL